MSKIMQLDWSKTARQFSVTHAENFLVSIGGAGKQASKHLAWNFPFSEF